MFDPTTDPVLELARIEREALARVRRKLASQQLGEAWIGLAREAGFEPAITVLETVALGR